MKPLYVFWGKVREGKKRGRKLEFPTANIRLSKMIPSGIYASVVKLKGTSYQAITFIGEAKTFDETLYQAETYIFDFTRSIYMYWLSVRLLKKLRENKKFSSAQILIRQMEKDKKNAQRFFTTIGDSCS